MTMLVSSWHRTREVETAASWPPGTMSTKNVKTDDVPPQRVQDGAPRLPYFGPEQFELSAESGLSPTSSCPGSLQGFHSIDLISHNIVEYSLPGV